MSESDRERWLTYVELGELLGCTVAAARMYAKRRGWRRRTPNMYGDRARVLVPPDASVQPRTAYVQPRTAHVITPDRGTANGPDQPNDRLNDSSVRVIEQVIDMLQKQLDIANQRWARADDALAGERERVNCAERQIEELRTELADARAAAQISSDTAAALRLQLDIVRARRPWWRRWLR